MSFRSFSSVGMILFYGLSILSFSFSSLAQTNPEPKMHAHPETNQVPPPLSSTEPKPSPPVLDPHSMSGIFRQDESLPSGTITVRLVKEGFQNLTGIAVELEEMSPSGKHFQSVTDGQGRATFSQISPGRYQAKATVLAKTQQTKPMEIKAAPEPGVRVLLYFPQMEEPAKETNASPLVPTENSAAASDSVQEQASWKKKLPAEPRSLFLSSESKIGIVMTEEFISVSEIFIIENPTQSPILIKELVLPLPKEAESVVLKNEKQWKPFLSVIQAKPHSGCSSTEKMGPVLFWQGSFPVGKQEIEVSFQLKHRGHIFFQQPIPLFWEAPKVIIVDPHPSTVFDSPMLLTSAHHIEGQTYFIAHAVGFFPGMRLEFQLLQIPHPRVWHKWMVGVFVGCLLLGFGVAFFRSNRHKEKGTSKE